MVVQHNLVAMNANRQLLINNKKMTGLTEKLSYGYRVNRAADDAAGLAMSEKMRRQIRGLTQASANAQDGISLVQSAEGAMNEIHAMLQRGTELAVKAANGTLTDEDRSMVDAEIQQLKQAIDQTAHHTVFNEMPLLYAQYSYAPSGKPVNMLVKVDTADFDDDDATGTGENAETLESTIAHELMHSVMQYNLTDGMSGRTGDKYPTWFIEGTAQLAGGEFPTNWNNALLNYANENLFPIFHFSYMPARCSHCKEIVEVPFLEMEGRQYAGACPICSHKVDVIKDIKKWNCPS